MFSLATMPRFSNSFRTRGETRPVTHRSTRSCSYGFRARGNACRTLLTAFAYRRAVALYGFTVPMSGFCSSLDPPCVPA